MHWKLDVLTTARPGQSLLKDLFLPPLSPPFFDLLGSFGAGGRPLLGVGLPWLRCTSVSAGHLVLTPSTITCYSRGTCSLETVARSPSSSALTCGLSRFPSPGPPPQHPLASWGEALCPPQLFIDLHACVSAVSQQHHAGY